MRDIPLCGGSGSHTPAGGVPPPQRVVLQLRSIANHPGGWGTSRRGRCTIATKLVRTCEHPGVRKGGAIMRVGIIGGGPAGSFFALYALKYARLAGRELSLTIYEYKDFAQRSPVGCNMCAGLIPAHVVRQLVELDLVLPAGLLLGRIDHYALHTSAGAIDASPPDPSAEVFGVYRGAGPCAGPRADL